MITPDAINRRALAHYYDWLQAIAAHNPDFEALIIKKIGDKRTTDESRLANLDEIAANSKAKKGYGYDIRLDTAGPRSTNKQSRIGAIVFETGDDLLRFLGKNLEFEQFQQSLMLLQTEAPQLEAWCIEHVKEICAYADVWPELLSVWRFFMENPNPGLPLRLLPIEGIDTKFIARHNGILCKIIDAGLAPEYIDARFIQLSKRYRLPEHEPFIACYFNDPELVAYFQGFTALAFPANQFAQNALPVRTVIIVENHSSVHQILAHPLPGALVIFGGGFGVALLKTAQWLKDVQLHYWGDLDTHGLAILSQVRGYFPHVRPFRMDMQTWQAHQQHAGPGKPFRGDTPKYLTGDERTLFQYLQEHNLRVEQERLTDIYVADFFKN
jgi:hypothetical protein